MLINLNLLFFDIEPFELERLVVLEDEIEEEEEEEEAENLTTDDYEEDSNYRMIPNER
jgi:hypothetical protein